MKDLPKWASEKRSQWEYRGQKRPPFAKEPSENEESVWDYPRPPALDPDDREVVVKLNDTVLARTTNAIRVLETASPPAFYLPPEDIKSEYLQQTEKTSRCEWKGEAVYWDIIIDEDRIINAAWSYPLPFDGYEKIAGHVSFYPDKVECYVDGQRVKPQPGEFYGGWITSEIVGPVKGESGKTYL